MTDKVESAEKSASKEEGVLIYELSYHLLPTLSEEETLKAVEAFKSLIQKNGGSLLSDEAPKQMDLAYAMVKKQEGKNAKFDTSLFGAIKFKGETSVLEPLKEELDLSKDVLRYLIIKTVLEFQPITQRVFTPVVEETAKPIRKPEVVEEKSDKPISEAELDKTIEELVSD